MPPVTLKMTTIILEAAEALLTLTDSYLFQAGTIFIEDEELILLKLSYCFGM